ncbi:MAG: pseudouridine-5'-phosphate glycosidase [Phycisphaerales bacterium]
MHPVSRAGTSPHRAVALESTLLLHGIPKGEAPALDRELRSLCAERGVTPLLVALLAGVPIVGLNEEELADLLTAWHVPKANTANLGLLLYARSHGATTVSTTMELASAAGVRVFATGGLGGAHKNFGNAWDVSSDLVALTRIPMAVVASGVKSLLDIESTREMLETVGVPCVGFRTDQFPAFYMRSSGAKLDARFDDERELAAFLAFETKRTGRAVLVCNPIPEADEIDEGRWGAWLREAERAVADAEVSGRDVTPALLAELHRASGGATLRANLALVRSNVRLAAGIAAHWGE